MTTDVAEIGLAVDSSQVVDAKNRLDQLADSGKRASTATDLFKQGWLSMTASISAGMAVYETALGIIRRITGALQEQVLMAARYETMGVVMERVGRQAGYSASQMHGFQAALQAGGISAIEARETLASMTMAHIDLSKAAQLSRLAQDAAVIANTNSSEAFQRVVYGIQTAQPEILRTLGLTVNFHQEYAKMATVLNKNVASLTESEKMQARLNAVLAKGADIAGVYSDAMDTAGKQLNSLKRFQDNLAVAMGQIWQDTLIIGVRTYTDYLITATNAQKELAEEGAIKEWGRDIAMTFAVLADVVNDFVQGMRAAGVTLLGFSIMARGTLINLLTGGMAGKGEIKRGWEFMEQELGRIGDKLGQYTANAEKLFAEQEKRAKDRKEKELKDQRDYAEKALQIQKLYAGYSLQVQQQAQMELAKAYFPGSFRTPEEAPKREDPIVKQQNEALEGLRRRIELAKQSSEVEKMTFEITKGNYIKFSEATKKRLLELAAEIDANERRLAVEKRMAELANARAKQMTDDANVANDILNWLDDYDNKIQRETEGLRQTNAEKEKAKFLAEAEQKWREKSAELSEEYDNAEYERLKSNYDLRVQRLATIIEENAAYEEMTRKTKELAEKEKKSWEDIFSSIDKAAERAFVDVLEGGRDAFTRLADTIKTTVLAALYQMTVRKWVIDIVGSITGQTDIANALLGRAAGEGGNSLISSAAGSFASNYLGAGSIGSWASLLGGDFMAGWAAGGAGIPSSAVMTSGVTGSASMAELGTMLGSIPGWGWALAAVIAIGTWLSSRASGGPKTGGSFTGEFDSTGRYTGAVQGAERLYTPNQADAEMERLTIGWGRTFQATLRQLGGTLGSSIRASFGFDMDPQGSAQNRFTARLRDAQGNTIYEHTTEGGRDPKDLQAAIALETKRALLAGLQQADFPQEVRDILNSLTAVTATSDEIDAVIKKALDMKTALQGLANIHIEGLDINKLKELNLEGETLTETLNRVATVFSATSILADSAFGAVGIATLDARTQLIEFAGGIQAFSSAMQTYYQEFYSESERATMGMSELGRQFTALGITDIPTTKEGFRHLMESIDLTTESGRQLYASLLLLAPAFASVVNASDAAAARLASQTQTLRSINLQMGGATSNQASLQLATQAFMANASWTAGSSWQSIASALMTITEADFANYSESQRELINQIRGFQFQEISNQQQSAAAAAQAAAQAQQQAAQAAQAAVEELRRLREQLYDWANKQFLGAASPLTPEEKYKRALDEYEKVAASGDITKFQGVADALIATLGDFYAKGSEEYRKVWDMIMHDAERIGGFDLTPDDTTSTATGGRGSGGDTVTITEVRRLMADTMAKNAAETADLKKTVQELIKRVSESSSEQVKTMKETATEMRTAVVNAIETTR